MNTIKKNTPGYLFCVLAIIAFTVLLSACSDSKVEKQLSQAETLIIEQPDSTVAILANMDTTIMSESQKARQELLYLYTQLVYGYQLPLDSATIADGDRAFNGGLDEYEIKWLIVKSAEANRQSCGTY